MLKVLLFVASGILAINLIGCAGNTADSTHKPRKVYYARDVQTGSHLQRAYTEPTPMPDVDAPGSVSVGSHAFNPVRVSGRE